MSVGRRTTQPLGTAINKCLHYRGDCTGQGIEGQTLGPNGMREYWVIVSTEYDPVTDRTTAHVRPARPDDLATAVSA